MIAKIQHIGHQYPAATTLAIGLLSLMVVGTAWLFQFAGYLPCQLCLWQRIPYYVAGPLLILAGLLAYVGIFGQRYLVDVLLFAGFVFVASTMLAAYHTGVEWAFWQGPTSCGVGENFSTTDASDLLGALSSTRPPSCDEAAGRFLGLSFAGWNVIASVGLAVACFVMASASKARGQTTK